MPILSAVDRNPALCSQVFIVPPLPDYMLQSSDLPYMIQVKMSVFHQFHVVFGAIHAAISQFDLCIYFPYFKCFDADFKKASKESKPFLTLSTYSICLAFLKSLESEISNTPTYIKPLLT